MKQRILVDNIVKGRGFSSSIKRIKRTLVGIGEGRGFFSAINLTLLTILYCRQNNIQPIVGNSVLSLYGSRLEKKRPFSEFFGAAFDGPISKSAETLEISLVHNNQLLSFNDDLVIQELRLINRELLVNMEPDLKDFINSPPSLSSPSFDISVHYRGCDYLKYTPAFHHPNLKPEVFIRYIEKFIFGHKVFVATDDDSFIGILIDKGFDIVYFKDVYRKGPGRGSHTRSWSQHFGLPGLVSQKRKGFEVFRDCFWLSKSNHYIGSNSNLMYYSSLLNPLQVSKNLSLISEQAQ